MQLLEPDQTLPDLRTMPEAGELVGIATDLSPATLLRAYTKGLFPAQPFRSTQMAVAAQALRAVLR